MFLRSSTKTFIYEGVKAKDITASGRAFSVDTVTVKFVDDTLINVLVMGKRVGDFLTFDAYEVWNGGNVYSYIHECVKDASSKV